MKLQLILYTLLIVLTACKKKDTGVTPSSPSLPPYTETGANTFAWIINEKELVIAKDNWPTDPGIKGYYGPSNNILEVRGMRVFNSNVKSCYIYASNVTGKGKYKLSNGQRDYAFYYLNDKEGNNDQSYNTDSLHIGEVEITFLDTVNRIVSGKFSFKALEYTSTGQPLDSVISIRGQFDYKYPNY